MQLTKRDKVFGRVVSKTVKRAHGKRDSSYTTEEYVSDKLWVNINGAWSITTWLQDQQRFNGFTAEQEPEVYKVLNPDELKELGHECKPIKY